MNAMELAQVHRKTEWYEEALREAMTKFRSAELALVSAKKKSEEAKAEVDEAKRQIEQYKQVVIQAEMEFRKSDGH